MPHNNSENYVIIACRKCKVNNRVITRKAALAVCGNCRWTLLLYDVKISKEPNTEASNYLVQRLVGLLTRFRALQRNLEDELIDVGDAERELNACEALTKTLYEYATRHNIQLLYFSEQIFNIASASQDVTGEISRRKRRSILQRGRWKKSVNAAIKVTNFILLLIGLPTFLHLIPEDKKLLKSASYKELSR